MSDIVHLRLVLLWLLIITIAKLPNVDTFGMDRATNGLSLLHMPGKRAHGPRLILVLLELILVLVDICGVVFVEEPSGNLGGDTLLMLLIHDHVSWRSTIVEYVLAGLSKGYGVLRAGTLQ